MAKQVGVAHSVGRDRFQPRQEVVGFRVLARDLRQRILAEQVRCSGSRRYEVARSGEFFRPV